MRRTLALPKIYVNEHGCVSDFRNNWFKTVGSMCKAYGVNRTTFIMRLKAGYPLKKSLLGIHFEGCLPSVRGDAVYFEGSYYPSISCTAQSLGISPHLILNRINQDMSLDEAVGDYRKCKTERLSVENNLQEASRQSSKSVAVIRYRLDKGMSLQEAMAKPVRKNSNKRCKDHLGNQYDSINSMVVHYGITYSQYYNRLQRGWTLERILTTPLRWRS